MSISPSGSNITLGGTGGTPNVTYYVLTSTNPALPLSSWIPVATNTFDASGNFTFTDSNTAGTPQRYYTLLLP